MAKGGKIDHPSHHTLVSAQASGPASSRKDFERAQTILGYRFAASLAWGVWVFGEERKPHLGHGAALAGGIMKTNGLGKSVSSCLGS